jgi:Fe-S cluster biosynthesis and repair protein YggX
MREPCTRCGTSGPALSEPPIPGRWGRALADQVCQECWSAWRNEQTLVMNHYGLRPWVPADRERLYGLMSEFLKMCEPD